MAVVLWLFGRMNVFFLFLEMHAKMLGKMWMTFAAYFQMNQKDTQTQEKNSKHAKYY